MNTNVKGKTSAVKTSVAKRKKNVTKTKRPSEKNSIVKKSVFVSDSDEEEEDEPRLTKPSKKPQRHEDNSSSDSQSESQSDSENDSNSDSDASSDSTSDSDSGSGSGSGSDSSSDDSGSESDGPTTTSKRRCLNGGVGKNVVKSQNVSTALIRSVEQLRSEDWLLHACALIRFPAMYHDLLRFPATQNDSPYFAGWGSSSKLTNCILARSSEPGVEDFVKNSWSWLKEVGPYITEAIKAELLLTTLTNFGSIPALKLLGTLGFPAYFHGQFFIRYFWGGLYNDVCTHALQQFIRAVADDAAAKTAYGTRHVYLRLMARAAGSEDVHVKDIVDHDSTILLRRIKSVEDVNDLLSLGWRPNICTLLHHAQSHSLHRVIKDLAPAICTDLSTTIPMWHDSPFDPVSTTAPNLDGTAEFWNAVPDYWIRSVDQIQRECPSFSQERASKMPAIEPGDLQRTLALMHKSPTLIRFAWAKKSLTWLTYIVLFRTEHFYTLLQVLLQPPLPRPPCLCQIHRLTHINNVRNGRRKKQRGVRPQEVNDARDVEIGPRCHQNCDNEYPSAVIHEQQCKPWYRTAAPSNSDRDRYDMINEVLHDRKLLQSPYSLNMKGRVVAIAHLLMLLNAKGITATSIQILGDIVAAWPTQPSIKDLRPLLAKMHTLTQNLSILPDFLPKQQTNNNNLIEKKTVAVVDGSVLGSLGSSGAVQSHVLYRKPKDALLCSAMKRLHVQLTEATCKWIYTQPLKLTNPNTQLLREIYDSLDKLIFPVNK